MGVWRGVALGAALAMVALPTLAHVVRPGDPASSFTVRTFDKQRITQDDVRGQVVIINRWATWCGPCKRELPLLDAYYRAHAKQGLRIFAVTTEDTIMDYQLKPLENVLAFPLAHSITGSGFPTLEGVPTNYVIDRHGVVRYAKAAAFDEQTLDEVIGPLLAEARPATPPPAAPAKTAAN